MLMAVVLQLLSNLANDLGDFQHGTDITGKRVGPERTVQSGAISPQAMKIGISISIGLSLLIGGVLIYNASIFINIWYMLLLMFLGVMSIWAALKYTIGSNPYGYKGLGDIAAFLFFGPVAVVGTCFLHVHKMTFAPWLPAIGLGLFTAAVLNINNMRDMDNDFTSGKTTLAIRLGLSKARLYHALLTIIGIASFVAYSVIYSNSWHQYLYLVWMFAFVFILYKIYTTDDKKQLDPYLKQTSIATFVLSVLFVISINL
jgi:1,4-dihydroxy-2-naphthoate octaprenyltransferase